MRVIELHILHRNLARRILRYKKYRSPDDRNLMTDRVFRLMLRYQMELEAVMKGFHHAVIRAKISVENYTS